MNSDDWNVLILEDPFKYKIIGNNKKKMHTTISFLLSLKIIIDGIVKKDMHSMLRAYVPINDMI